MPEDLVSAVADAVAARLRPQLDELAARVAHLSARADTAEARLDRADPGGRPVPEYVDAGGDERRPEAAIAWAETPGGRVASMMAAGLDAARIPGALEAMAGGMAGPVAMPGAPAGMAAMITEKPGMSDAERAAVAAIDAAARAARDL